MSEAWWVFGTARCEMVTYKLIAVKHKDVSLPVAAEGEIDPDFLPTPAKKQSAPQAQTIHTYIHTYIGTPTYIGPMGEGGGDITLSPPP